MKITAILSTHFLTAKENGTRIKPINIALDVNPTDTLESVIEKMRKIQSLYELPVDLRMINSIEIAEAF